MPLQNRVQPDGQILATPARGAMMGNRGILHAPDRTLGTARWRHKAWVCCVLAFKGRQRKVMAPNTYTELFFLDEAVALAAGHRPCAECRRRDYLAFVSAWERATGTRPKAGDMDKAMHPARVTRNRQQVRYKARAATLPDGTYVALPEGPAVIWGAQAFPYTAAGYAAPICRPDVDVTVLTPRPTVAALQSGYRPILHSSAQTHIS